MGPAPLAGQFYMLSSSAGWGGASGRPHLGRAFSVCRARAGRLEFLLEAIGPGTERLGALAPGEDAWVVGPLGIGFRDPAPGGRALLVGGGIGVAPLVIWEEALRARGTPTSTLLGFRNASFAEAARLFGGETAVATDDGTGGSHHGLVTDLVQEHLAPGDEVYACGPPAMLEAVRRICEARSVVRAARARGRHGLRLWRLLRLRGAHAPRLPAALRGRPRRVGGRPRRGLGMTVAPPRTTGLEVDLAGLQPRPSRPERLRNLGRDCCDPHVRRPRPGSAPLRRVRLQDDHARSPRGQCPAAPVGDPGRADQLHRAAEQGPGGLPATGPAGAGDAPRPPDRERGRLLAGGVRDARGGRRRTAPRSPPWS